MALAAGRSGAKRGGRFDECVWCSCGSCAAKETDWRKRRGDRRLGVLGSGRREEKGHEIEVARAIKRRRGRRESE